MTKMCAPPKIGRKIKINDNERQGTYANAKSRSNICFNFYWCREMDERTGAVVGDGDRGDGCSTSQAYM